MSEKLYPEELTRWYLAELANTPAADVEGDHFEVIGEADSSHDVSVTLLASSAVHVIFEQTNRIKALEKTLRELRDMARSRSQVAYKCGPIQYTSLCDTVAEEANDVLKSEQRAENGSSDPSGN